MSVMDLSEYVRHLDRAPELVRVAAVRGVRDAAMRSITQLVRRTREVPPPNPGRIGHGGAVNTGNLVRRWKWQATPVGADVLNDATYTPVVEGGRRPGAKGPPVEAIVEWARRRLGMGAITAAMARVLRATYAGHVVTHQRTTYSPHVAEHRLYQFAWMVARAIKARGLLPRPIMTASDFQDWLRQTASEAIGREVREALAGGEA